MEWLKLVLASSIVASAMNLGLQWYRDEAKRRRERREDASLSALYIALLLEQYASDCSDLAGEVATYIDTKGHHGTLSQTLPTKPASPSDINWKSLGVELTAKFLQLWVAVQAADRRLEDERDYDGGEEAAISLVDYAVEYGIDAFNMASEFRQSFSLPDRDHYSPYEWLLHKDEELSAKRIARARAVAQLSQE